MKLIQIFVVLFLTAVTVIFSHEKPKLIDYKFNIYSQFGEDGIIAKIFEIIGTESKICIEFGAWDGYHLSNTANLWTNDWIGVLIECDSIRYNQLSKNVPENCYTLKAKVGIGENALENILKKNNILFTNVDLLSIDIDSDDYYIFESLQTLKPRVIICEYNPTIPPHLDIYPEFGSSMGCSVASLCRIALQKGYKLIALTDVNCFFLLESEFDKFDSFETKLEAIKIEKYLRFVITDYSGRHAVVAHSDFVEPYGVNTSLTTKLFGNFKRLFYSFPM